MGLNSPIELTMTAAGLAAKENAESIIFTRFLAGADGAAGSSSVTTIKQVIPINNYTKRIAGQEYIQDGITQIPNESSLSISGFANSLDASEDYILNEIALMAKLDENSEEFCFAYDWSDAYKYRIRTDLSQPIIVHYKIILTRVPQITVNVSETGVTFTDLYSHTEKTVTQTPVHGLKCVDGVLTINDRALHKSTVGLGNVDNTSDLDKPVSTATQLAITGLSNRIDGITLSSLGGASSTDLSNHTTNTSNPHSVTYTQVGAAAASHTHTESDITDLGSYASSTHTHTTSDITDISDLATASGLNTYGVSSMSFDTSTNVLTLTMKDGNTKTVTIPASSGSGSGNSGLTVSSITYDDANERLVFTMNDNSTINCDISDLVSSLNITYSSFDNRTYNSEWIERLTGSGTALDPYLIYTPRDFMKINDDMTAHYKLMNNLDFAPVSGLSIEISGDGYEITTTDNTAALYNNGEGFWPIGYDGYFPLNGETRSTSTFAEANWSSEIIYGTNNAALASIFTGELDGNNKIIKGIICSPENTYSVGLFSFLGNGASVHNFTIKDSVFIVNDVYVTGDKKSSVASVAGNLIYTTGVRNAVNIYNIYNYATIISNRSTSNGDENAQINGIFGRLNGDTNPGYIVRECANHGELIIVNDSVHHGCSGIGYYKEYSNGDNRIINCINTANLYGFKVFGIGQNIGKININCGNMTKSNEYYGEIWPITDHRSNSYIDGNQFVNITNQSVANSDYTTDGSWNVYYKSATELKSQAFIDEANALLPEPVFAYNDLNVNDGWPLLIDEYNTLIGVNGNLNLSLIDPINNKLYKSGYSLKRLQKTVTYREMNTEINGQFSQYVSTQLSGLKTITTIVATTDWTAEEESGTPTGNYLATVTASGITASSPVQLMTQLTNLEIEISEISSNSVTLIANSEPQSDIRIGIMFIP